MTEGAPSQGRFPDHVDQAVRAIAQLHAEHHGRATTSQRTVNRISALIARPLFVAFVIAGVASWMGANLAEMQLSGRAVDPPAFPWLQVAVNLVSLFIVTLILVAQKHEDELNARRDILTLELATLSERQIAKIIELLEELRRDSPQIPDRIDHQAVQMARPADPANGLGRRARRSPLTLGHPKEALRSRVSRRPVGTKLHVRRLGDWRPISAIRNVQGS
jgi:uncharacterized membrane protein